MNAPPNFLIVTFERLFRAKYSEETLHKLTRKNRMVDGLSEYHYDIENGIQSVHFEKYLPLFRSSHYYKSEPSDIVCMGILIAMKDLFNNVRLKESEEQKRNLIEATIHYFSTDREPNSIYTDFYKSLSLTNKF